MKRDTPSWVLREYLSRYPKAPAHEKSFRSAPRIKWPDWCWLPMAASHTIVSATKGTYALGMDSILDVSVLSACLAWRQTKTIYRFDATLAAALMEQPIEGDLPNELLFRLPEWCVWIEAPGLSPDGAFAWMEYDYETQTPELRLLYIVVDGGVVYPYPVTIILGPGGLTEAYERVIASMERNVGEIPARIEKERDEGFGPMIASTIQLVLYLCSAEPDMPEGYKPAWKRPGHSVGPSVPRTWDVGLRIGSAIRAHYNRAVNETTPSEMETTSRASMRPHIRRAHWHTYRIGEGRGKIEIKWIPPVLVGGKSADDLPATIRAVK